MATLILERVLGLLVSISTPSTKWIIAILSHFIMPYTFGVGTVFDSPTADRFNVGELACVSHNKPTVLAANMINRGLFVAHQKLPCYQFIHLCVPRNGRCTYAVVADRGPLHVDVDLYKNLALVLKHNGLEQVKWKKIFLKDDEVKRVRKINGRRRPEASFEPTHK